MCLAPHMIGILQQSGTAQNPQKRSLGVIERSITFAYNLTIREECDYMKKQLQGIALILLSILLMLGFGNAPLFDFSLRWSFVFSVTGIVGVVMTFLPDKKS